MAIKETRKLEYKSEITNNFLKTVSAYANFGTGSIKFGITDNGEIIGIDNPERACLDIENKLNDSIVPKPDFRLSIDKKNNAIELIVYEGRYKPYLYKGKAYRRSDTSTVEVDRVELLRLTREGSNLYFEELPSERKTLTFNYLETKLIEKMGITGLSDDVLHTLGFYTDDGRFNIAAELFSDDNTYYGIDIARFGQTISEILDRETHTGISVLKQYDATVSMYRRYYQYDEIKGIERQTIEIIPEKAFREAVANALVHRTWDINSHIRVFMYSDRIEISSPGGLPKGLSEEGYLNGNISNLRNPILGNIFFRLHYIEMFGTGIRRIMEAYEGYTLKLSFDIFENSIRVTLPLLSKKYSVTPNGQEIMKILESGIEYSGRELAERVGWSKDKTIRTVNYLKDAGYLRANGNGRSTKYSKR